MKKLLIGTSALVIAGFAAGAAQAQIELGLSGSSQWGVGVASQDNVQNVNNPYRAVDVKGETTVNFGGSTTLDNGLTVAFSTGLRTGGNAGHANGTQTDDHITVSGDFGMFRIGNGHTALGIIHRDAPHAAGGTVFTMGGGDVRAGRWVSNATAAPVGIGAAPATNQAVNRTRISADADHLTYISPAFEGFQVAASYVPNAREHNNAINQGANTHGWGVGAVYNNTFDGVGVHLRTGYLYTDADNIGNGANRVTGTSSWMAGAEFSYAGFTFGGGYAHNNNRNNFVGAAGDGFVDSTSAWDVGVRYTTGPYSVSLAYFSGKADRINTNAATSWRDDHIKHWAVGGNYNLGPGVDLRGAVHYIDFQNTRDNLLVVPAAGDAQKNKGWAAITGLHLTF